MEEVFHLEKVLCKLAEKRRAEMALLSRNAHWRRAEEALVSG